MLLFIEILACFLGGSFVVMFSLGLDLLLPLMILWMFLILFTYNFRKVFLIFKISLVLDNKACVYDFLVFFFSVGLVSFLKNLDIFMISLGVFAGIGKGSLTKLIVLSVNLLLIEVALVFWIFGMNLDATHYLNVLFSLSVMSEF